jgi:hypothetical protein
VVVGAKELPDSLPDSAQIRQLLDSAADKTDSRASERKVLKRKEVEGIIGNTSKSQKPAQHDLKTRAPTRGTNTPKGS